MRMNTVRASEYTSSVVPLSARTVTFVVEEKLHPRFERVDDDLVVKLNITLSHALLGPEGGGTIAKEVEQLDGRRIQVALPDGVSDRVESSANYPANSAGWTGDPYNRRRNACFKGWISETKRRSDSEVECCLSKPSHSGAEARAAKGAGIDCYTIMRD